MSRHQHHPHHPHNENSSVHPRKSFHRDWRFIVAVILMLIAIIVYVMTLDDSVVPVPTPENPPGAQPASP